MENLIELFKMTKQQKMLSVYFTAGYKPLNETVEICLMLEKAGIDFIELGIPGSDPLADGPVIQECSEVSLQNGFTLSRFFTEIKSLNRCKIPVLLMGYYNQVIQFGEEKFIQKAKECSVSGFIIPDQPLESTFHQLCKENNMANVRMICPTTPIERIKLLDELSTGFIYAVSASSTTGNLKRGQEIYLSALNTVALKNPLITGFGIKDKTSFKELTESTRGGIVGTAFMQVMKRNESINQEIINEFIQSIN